MEIHQRALFKDSHLRKWQNEVGFGLFSEVLQDGVNNLLLM